MSTGRRTSAPRPSTLPRIYGQPDAVRVLLEAGANVEAADIDGWRPLHAASKRGDVAAATLLLDAGADVNALSNGGDSPLARAASPEMRELLAARGGVVEE